MRPDHLTGSGIDGDDSASRAGGRVENPVGDERRRLEIEFRRRAQVVGFESPCDLEIVEIRAGDLVEGRIMCIPQVAPVRAPFSVLRSLLRDQRCHAQKQTHDGSLHSVLFLCVFYSGFALSGSRFAVSFCLLTLK